MTEQGTTFYGMNFTGAWSIGTSKRAEWYLNPSKEYPQYQKLTLILSSFIRPGKYQPNFIDKPATAQYRFGTSQRQGLENKAAFPPVGQYNIAEKIEQNEYPAYSIGKKLSLDLKGPAVGPGKYNPKDIGGKSSSQFTFGYKEEFKLGKEGPAPNLYQNNVDEERYNRTAERLQSFEIILPLVVKNEKLVLEQVLEDSFLNQQNQAISPGQYNSDIKMTLTSPKISFPKSIREPLKKFVGPGPGQYAPKLTHSKSQGYSIGNKYIPLKTSDIDTPGPGTYQPEKPQSMQNTRFGREGKHDMVDKEQKLKPGPGDYDQYVIPDKISHLNQDFQSIGQSDRPPIANLQNVPGPGKYESLEKIFEGPKYSMRIKNEKNKLNLNPGPGQYEPDDVTDKRPDHYTVPYTPNPGLGRSNRTTPVYSKLANVGPGSYNISGQLGGSKYSMGKQQRLKQREDEDLGPAQYKIPDTIGKIPKYLIDKNKESKFMMLQVQEQKLRLSGT